MTLSTRLRCSSEVEASSPGIDEGVNWVIFTAAVLGDRARFFGLFEGVNSGNIDFASDEVGGEIPCDANDFRSEVNSTCVRVSKNYE